MTDYADPGARTNIPAFSLVFVVDTNILVHSTQLVSDLDALSARFAIRIIIPWIVIKELEALAQAYRTTPSHGHSMGPNRKASSPTDDKYRMFRDALNRVYDWLRQPMLMPSSNTNNPLFSVQNGHLHNQTTNRPIGTAISGQRLTETELNLSRLDMASRCNPRAISIPEYSSNGMPPSNSNQSSPLGFSLFSNDDLLLDCCLYFARHTESIGCKVILLTHDQNLSVKAAIHGINCVSGWTGDAMTLLERLRIHDRMDIDMEQQESDHSLSTTEHRMAKDSAAFTTSKDQHVQIHEKRQETYVLSDSFNEPSSTRQQSSLHGQGNISSQNGAVVTQEGTPVLVHGTSASEHRAVISQQSHLSSHNRTIDSVHGNAVSQQSHPFSHNRTISNQQNGKTHLQQSLDNYNRQSLLSSSESMDVMDCMHTLEVVNAAESLAILCSVVDKE